MIVGRAAVLLALPIAGCSGSVDPSANADGAVIEVDTLPRFEHVAAAALARLGRCAPDCAAPAPFLGIARVDCRAVSPGVARCGFLAVRRSFDQALENYGTDGAVGRPVRCAVTMRERQGVHGAYWEDMAGDPSRPEATSTVRCGAANPTGA